MLKYIALAAISVSFFACSAPVVEEEAPAAASEIVKLSAEERKSLGLQVAALQQQKLATTSKANGQLSVLNQHKAFVTSALGGVVKTLNYHLGESVKAGDVIATISHPDFLNWQEQYLSLRTQSGGADTIAALFNPQYINLREEYIALLPKIEFAQLELRRQQELQAGQAAPLKQLQQAETELKTLEARRNSLEKQLSITSQHARQNVDIQRAALEQKLLLLGINPQRLTAQNLQTAIALRSPIDGRISSLNAIIGQSVDINTPIAEVISTQNLSVELQVYEDQIHLFNVGKEFVFETLANASDTFHARVSHIGANLHPTQKTATVQADILDKTPVLLEGMSVAAQVHSPDALHWAVPQEGIAQADGKDYIFVLRSQSEQEWAFERIYVEKIIAAPPFVAVRLPKELDPTNLQIATNQAFFILGKMTNLGEE